MKRTALTRRTPLGSRSAPLRRSKLTRPRKADIPASVRAAVKRRAGGLCEACGEPGPQHMHHRKLRSQGGQHEAANLVHIHGACHLLIHANPDRAYALGLMVRSSWDPAAVSVRRFGEGPGELFGGAA